VEFEVAAEPFPIPHPEGCEELQGELCRGRAVDDVTPPDGGRAADRAVHVDSLACCSARLHQFKLPPATAYPLFPHLAKGEEEVGQVVDSAADEGQEDLELLPGAVIAAILEGRDEDKGMRGIRVFPHSVRGNGHRGFKHVAVRAPLFEDALGTAFRLRYAGGALEGGSEGPPEGGPLVGGEFDGCYGLEG